MFKILSTKKYKALKSYAERVKENFRDVFDAADEKIKRLEEENARLSTQVEEQIAATRIVQEGWSASGAQNKKLTAEVDKYKRLYADELQKRLSLAEKVKELEKLTGGRNGI